jgi:uncharacterized protein (UPF0332 family)
MEQESQEFVKIAPDVTRAVFATELASEILQSARDKFDREVFEDAYHESRSSIRAAASAVLIKDGYVATSFEATYKYLSRNYPGKLSLGDWESLEKDSWVEERGLMYHLLSAIGIIKKTDKQQAKQALAAAEEFLSSVDMILGRI